MILQKVVSFFTPWKWHVHSKIFQLIGALPFGDSQEQLGLLRNESPIYPPGYGDKSLILLMNHIDLTEEEKLCILYHRGAFTEMQYWKYYCKAIKKNQNVLFTHTAICSVIF